jgi:hypothetical protein
MEDYRLKKTVEELQEKVKILEKKLEELSKRLCDDDCK